MQVLTACCCLNQTGTHTELERFYCRLGAQYRFILNWFHLPYFAMRCFHSRRHRERKFGILSNQIALYGHGMGDCSFAQTTSSKCLTDASIGMKITETIYLCTFGMCTRSTPSRCSVASKPNRPEFVFIYAIGSAQAPPMAIPSAIGLRCPYGCPSARHA